MSEVKRLMRLESEAQVSEGRCKGEKLGVVYGLDREDVLEGREEFNVFFR